MESLTRQQLERILKKKGLDPKVSWFYTQFKQKFEEEYVMDNIRLDDAIANLVGFLKKSKIEQVLLFPEPSDTGHDTAAEIIETAELKAFLKKNVDTTTNTHVADKNLDWVFTITHEDDFFIAGSRDLVPEFTSHFKKARCTPFSEIENKWKG